MKQLTISCLKKKSDRKMLCSTCLDANVKYKNAFRGLNFEDIKFHVF